MTRMTGGKAIIKSLELYGVDTLFGLPGVEIDQLFVALYDEREAIRVIGNRHEQGCAYMAFGYAQSTGRVGAFAVVPGPGLLNASAALATAYSCNTRCSASPARCPPSRSAAVPAPITKFRINWAFCAT